MNKILKLKINENGQAVVEFALVMPLLLLLILGMIEFGWVLNGQINLTSAAREGARAAAVAESSTAQAVAAAAVNNSVGASSLTNINTVSIFDLSTRNVKVTVTANIHPIIGLYITEDVDLTEEAQMRIE